MKKIIAAALLTLGLAACQSAGTGTTDGPIKIGFIGPLTGDTAAVGNDMLHGIQWAIKEVNDAGGINGRLITLIAEDGRCTGSEAANAAQKLVNVDKVFVIIGGLCSGETLAAAPIAEAGKVVLLSPWSSNPTITNAGDYVFRNYPSDALKTPAMAKYFKNKGYSKIAMISENTDFAQGFRESLKSNLPAGAVVFDEVVDPGTKDFRSLLTRLKKVDFDVFFPNPNGDAVMAVLIQQFREAGFTEEALSHDVAESASIVQIAGESAEGFKFINIPSVGKGKFEEDFTAAYGKPQATIAWAAFAYDAANVLMESMKTGTVDGPSVKDALAKTSAYKGVIGTFGFDKNGDVTGVPFALKEYQGGKVVDLEMIPIDQTTSATSTSAMMEKATSSAMMKDTKSSSAY